MKNKLTTDSIKWHLKDHGKMAEAGYHNKLQYLETELKILLRIEQATAALSQLKPICLDNNISL